MNSRREAHARRPLRQGSVRYNESLMEPGWYNFRLRTN